MLDDSQRRRRFLRGTYFTRTLTFQRCGRRNEGRGSTLRAACQISRASTMFARLVAKASREGPIGFVRHSFTNLRERSSRVSSRRQLQFHEFCANARALEERSPSDVVYAARDYARCFNRRAGGLFTFRTLPKESQPLTRATSCAAASDTKRSGVASNIYRRGYFCRGTASRPSINSMSERD